MSPSKLNDSDAWHPTAIHANWQRRLVAQMKIGGIWALPSYGLTFKKIDENTLRLTKRFSPIIPELADCEPDEMLRRVIETCRLAKIKVVTK